MINTILFDCDGVLVDATELHYISLNKALKLISGFEISHEEHLAFFNGLPTKTKLKMLISDSRVNEKDKDAIFTAKQSYTKESIIETLPIEYDKIEMFKHLKHHKYNLACVTNSILETALLMLHTTGQLEYLDLLIANDQIKNPKPDPEGYLKAIKHFKTLPNETLIVEDSPVGLEAAYASGANVWAVKDLTEVTLENILRHL